MRRILILPIAFASVVSCAPVDLPRAQQGVLDLSSVDLLRVEPIAMDGQWEFFPEAFIAPGDVGSGSFIEVPGSWSQPGRGFSMPAHGYASYRIKVKLREPMRVGLNVGEIGTAYEIFANGKSLGGQGTAGLTPEESDPMTVPKTFLLLDGTDRDVEIVILVSNFHYRKGGIWRSMTIGSVDRILAQQMHHRWIEMALIASLLTLGLYHVGFVLIRRTAAVAFGLACMVVAARQSALGSKTLLWAFPWIPWEALIKIEYLTLIFAIPPFAFYATSLFPKFFSRRLAFVASAMSGLGFLFILFLPAAVYTKAVVPVEIYTFVAAVYMLSSVTRAFISGERYAAAILVAGSILGISILNDMLHYNHVINTADLTPLGLTAFVFAQAVIIARLTGISYIRAEHFAREARLRARGLRSVNRELSAFKQSLEDQVKARTKELVEAKERAEESAKAKIMFLANMSHELRTPLHSIIGFSNLVAGGNEGPEDNKRSVEIIEQSARHLLELVNDVLDYSKLDAGQVKLESVSFHIQDLLQNVRDAAEFKARSNGNTIEVIIGEGLPPILQGDPTRLMQVLTNLMTNAVKFTENGRITVSATRVHGTANESAVEFSVSDTGIGISEDHIRIICEPFVQADSGISRRYGGTGLGLSIVQMLLRMLGSRLNIQSQPGKGSTFSFVIQLAHGDVDLQVGPAGDPAQPLAPLSGTKVLLVDDSELNRILAERLLTAWNVQVDMAEDGRQAVDKSAATEYHVILMDLQMPVMNGFDAARAIRSRGSRTPIYAVTAAALSEVKTQSLEAGMDGCITKPFKPAQLYAAVQKYAPTDNAG